MVVLAELGENVITVTSGEEALEHLLSHEFAVVVLDVNMPRLDGIETARLIRQRPSLEQLPIIFVTSFGASEMARVKAYDVGAIDFLFTPVVPSILKAKVKVFVDLARSRKKLTEDAHLLARQNDLLNEKVRTIEQLNRRLQNANSQLELFGQSVSHDLRAPIRAVSGYVDWIQREHANDLPSQVTKHLNRITRAARQMEEIITGVLEYSRLLKSDFELGVVDLDELIGTLLQDFISVQEGRSQVIIQGPLLPVLAHKVPLMQALRNLIANALKFAPEDRKPTVTIHTESNGSQVRIWVEDNGIGIDPRYHASIFNMFERLDTSGRYEGTGLGLAIVKSAVERMGGGVGLESCPGEGSRFWIDLPAQVLPNAM